ncbi:MAG TPA: hypothetical protein VFL93_11250 [Longimicrobiaceae bacterium]|nr:hypothetical protein [Longimicrobiaceae bacterium]
MATRAAEELYYDSEATLRLVDTVLDELQVMEAEVAKSEDRVRSLTAHVDQAHAGIAGLPDILMRAHGEIQNVLASLRESRDVLERTTVEKIHHMNDKLREVTSATEIAATDILDGLDRSLALVDQLDTEEGEIDRSSVHAELRNELFAVMGCLQFQDITAQQLSYASSVLGDMESRLTQLAAIFDPASFGLVTETKQEMEAAGPRAFDPAATTQDAEQRQALVDEIFQTGEKNG